MKTRSTKTPKEKPRWNRECRAVFAILSEYLDGMLPARDSRGLRQHLRGCGPCTEYLESLRKTIRICQLYSVGPAPPLSKEVREAALRALEDARPTAQRIASRSRGTSHTGSPRGTR
jgi:anti-sigma factor RsiW